MRKGSHYAPEQIETMRMARHQGPFYVYALSDPATGLPFYIGKGKGRRCYHHRPSAKNNFLKGVLRALAARSLDPLITRIYETDDEQLAFDRERVLIAHLGRRHLGTGLLCNLTAGGEGCTGLVLSAEAKAKVGAAQRGRVHTAEHRAKNAAAHRGNKYSLGWPNTPAQRAATSIRMKGNRYATATKGRPKSPEHRAKMKGHMPMLGHAHSQQTREQMAVSQRQRRETERRDSGAPLICSQADCVGRTLARGLCHKHYESLRRRGTLPTKAVPFNTAITAIGG